MNDVTRDRLSTPSPAPTAPLRAPATVVPPVTATQVELNEAPVRQEARKPDLLHRQASRELADVWGTVAGEEPRKKTRQATSRRDGVKLSSAAKSELESSSRADAPASEKALASAPSAPGSSGPTSSEQASTPVDSSKLSTGQPAGSPDGNSKPTSGEPAGGAKEETASRQEVAREESVKDAGRTAAEAAPDPKAASAAKTEGAAREAATEQSSQAREQQKTAETRAENAREEQRVESKTAEADRQEREVAHRESKLHELKGAVASKSRRVQELQGRVREKEAQLSQVESDISAISGASDYLEHAEEVERLSSMRYFLRVELENEKQAVRAAEHELRSAESQARELETSVYEGKRNVAQQRYQVSKDKSALESRTATLQTRESQLDQRKQTLHSVEALRPFWAALRDESGLEEVAQEAADTGSDLNRRDSEATRRIRNNLSALQDPQAALDLVGGLDLSRATSSEQALSGMQLSLEKARHA